jgi:hypothetical protein
MITLVKGASKGGWFRVATNVSRPGSLGRFPIAPPPLGHELVGGLWWHARTAQRAAEKLARDTELEAAVALNARRRFSLNGLLLARCLCTRAS